MLRTVTLLLVLAIPRKIGMKVAYFWTVHFCESSRNAWRTLILCLVVLCLAPAAARAAIGPPPVISVEPLDQTALKGSTVTFTVLAVSGTTMTYQWKQNGSIISGATQSSYSLKAQNSATFSVDVANASGTVTSSNAALTVYSRPAANNDRYSVLQDHPLNVSAPGVLANDTDPNGLLLTATLGTLPSHGTLVLNPDGSFTYIPNPGFYGTDSFTYTAVDLFTGSRTGTVSITVTQIIDAPLILAVTGISSNGFVLKLSGPAPASYIISASTDFIKWTPISTNAVTTGALQFTDTNASAYPQQFYRAVAVKNW